MRMKTALAIVGLLCGLTAVFLTQDIALLLALDAIALLELSRSL